MKLYNGKTLEELEKIGDLAWITSMAPDREGELRDVIKAVAEACSPELPSTVPPLTSEQNTCHSSLKFENHFVRKAQQ